MPQPRLLDVLGLGRLRRARGAAEDQWRTTTGTVLSSSVQVGTAGTLRAEQPLVFYAYQVDGQVFQGQRIRYHDGPLQASAVVDRCSAGSAVIVFYDPADPANSTLRL